MQKKLKVVTIGGGSSYTPELLEGFLKRYHELPVSELWLVDVAEGQEKLDIISSPPSYVLASLRRASWMSVSR